MKAFLIGIIVFLAAAGITLSIGLGYELTRVQNKLKESKEDNDNLSRDNKITKANLDSSSERHKDNKDLEQIIKEKQDTIDSQKDKLKKLEEAKTKLEKELKETGNVLNKLIDSAATKVESLKKELLGKDGLIEKGKLKIDSMSNDIKEIKKLRIALQKADRDTVGNRNDQRYIDAERALKNFISNL